MINKTTKMHLRHAAKNSSHIEKVLTETWWLLRVIPLYSRDTILSTTM